MVVTLDTVRADRLGCYGYFRDTTPALDALAKQSLRFTRCLTPIAQTTPSHATLFTGVGPIEHGVLSNSVKKPGGDRTMWMLQTSPTLQTVAQVLRARGMKTGGFVAATPVKKGAGLDAGFEAWTQPTDTRRPANRVVADALRFVENCGNAPFFAWIHVFDAHAPFEPPFPPKTYLERFADAVERPPTVVHDPSEGASGGQQREIDDRRIARHLHVVPRADAEAGRARDELAALETGELEEAVQPRDDRFAAGEEVVAHSCTGDRLTTACGDDATVECGYRDEFDLLDQRLAGLDRELASSRDRDFGVHLGRWQ